MKKLGKAHNPRYRQDTDLGTGNAIVVQQQPICGINQANRCAELSRKLRDARARVFLQPRWAALRIAQEAARACVSWRTERPVKITHAFILMVAILWVNPSFACSVAKELSLEEQYIGADHVVLAKVKSTRVVEDPSKANEWERETVEASYDVMETFKGDNNPSIARELVMGPGNCMMGLLAGNIYVFFLKGPERFAGWPSGSFMIWNVDGTQVKPKLAELRSLKTKHAK